MAYAVSPGLRADLGGFAALVGDAYATGVEGFVLSFGAFAPVVYFFAMVAREFVAPIPSGPFSYAAGARPNRSARAPGEAPAPRKSPGQRRNREAK